MRLLRIVSCAVVLVLAVELAVLEAFLVGARVFGEPLPVAAALAAVANIVLAHAGARIVGAGWGAVVPGGVWIVLVFVLATSRPEGDIVVTDDLRGFLLLVFGAVAVVIGATTARATPAGSNGR